MICPHIDYERGWRVYAALMEPCRQAIMDAELLIVLGTDHYDDGNPLTLTKQSYQTPYGILPTDVESVEILTQQLTGIDTLRGELRHQYEHSLELALVWLHHMRVGAACSVLPILCGAHEFLFEDGTGNENAWVSEFVETIRAITKHRKTLIVAAADLAHVGAVFGGPKLPPDQRVQMALADEKLLLSVIEGNHQAFIGEIQRVEDRNNVCGITPIYLLLRSLSPARGHVLSYELCPADHAGTSWVSICGVIFS
jgi:AmmeMemoRadiSam system protein B